MYKNCLDDVNCGVKIKWNKGVKIFFTLLLCIYIDSCAVIRPVDFHLCVCACVRVCVCACVRARVCACV